MGNPGVGKSTILNSVAGKYVFKSGVSIGRGMTYELQQVTVGNVTYCDTPGLSDIKLRKEAGQAISSLLKQGGLCKILFVVTLEGGRIRPVDITTIQLIHDAAPEINNNFAIIVNKCSKRMLEKLSKEENWKELATSLFHGLNDEFIHDAIHLLAENEDLKDADDEFVQPNTFQGFVEFMFIKAPLIDLNPNKVKDVKTDEFEAMHEKFEDALSKLEADLDLKNAEIQKMTLRFEEEREKRGMLSFFNYIKHFSI